MRSVLARRFFQEALNHSRSTSRSAIVASPTSYFSRRYAVSASVAQEDAETIVFPREGPGVSYGLNWALAGRGVIVKDKAFYNLKSSELQQKGGSSAESLSGLPLHVRGDLVGSSSKISKAKFSKLLKQYISKQIRHLISGVEKQETILCYFSFSHGSYMHSYMDFNQVRYEDKPKSI